LGPALPRHLMENSKTLVVVSHYESRSKEPLAKLTGKLKSLTNNLLVVINDDAATSISIEASRESVLTLRRPNTGMNIGAWDSAYHAYPDYEFYIGSSRTSVGVFQSF
jgi:hypothetical protein